MMLILKANEYYTGTNNSALCAAVGGYGPFVELIQSGYDLYFRFFFVFFVSDLSIATICRAESSLINLLARILKDIPRFLKTLFVSLHLTFSYRILSTNSGR